LDDREYDDRAQGREKNPLAGERKLEGAKKAKRMRTPKIER
jgi:hypothetical protein